MNWTPQRKIALGFWLVAIVPVIMGLLGILSLRSLFSNADVLAHTNKTIRQLDKVFVNLGDVESAESEFLLTGNEAALKPYQDATEILHDDLLQLEPLTRDNTDQRLWFEHLRTLVDQKLRETRRILELRRTGKTDEATQLRQQLGKGARTMDDIRTTIRRIRNSEEKQLTSRTAAQNWDEYSSFITFLLVVAVNVALVSSLYWLIRHEEQQMRQLATQLEQRVEQRTQALKQSNEDLQQFAYIVSHDLQEPLRMVGSYTELLRRKYEGRLGEDADEYIGFAVEGVKRMTALIKDLLEYSRAGEGEDKTPEPVDAEEALETVLLDLQALIEDAGAQITHDHLPVVMTHRVWFTQVLQNLVGNALKYRSERPPRVHLSAKEDSFQVTFAVSDNGIGIDPRYADQVFGVFKRLHGRDIEGTGIGLAMCKKIVERAGGRIWFESQPGEGSTFFFTLPHIVTVSRKPEFSARAASAAHQPLESS